MTRWMAIAIGLGFVVLNLGEGQSADKRKPAEERREAERIQAARKALAEASQQVEPARSAVRAAADALSEAQKRHAQAVKSLRELRERVEGRLGQKVGLDEGVAAHQAAEKRYQEAAAPILARLKESQPYRAAVAEAAAARAELERTSKAPGGSTEASAQRLALLTVTQGPAQHEKQALDADEAVVAARQTMLQEQARVAALRAEVHSGVDGDTQVRTALAAVESLKDKVEQRQQEVARKRQLLERVQGQVARARQAVDSAVRADRKDDQQDRKPDKNKNKKVKKSGKK